MVKRQAEEPFDCFQSNPKMMYHHQWNHHPNAIHQPLSTPNPITYSPNPLGQMENTQFPFPVTLPEVPGLDPIIPWNNEIDDKEQMDENINTDHSNTALYPEHDEQSGEKMIPITDPLNHTTYYIGELKLSELLRKHGSLVAHNNNHHHHHLHHYHPGQMAQLGSLKQQKQTIIEKFCNAKTLASCTENDVRELQRLDVNITPVTNRDVHLGPSSPMNESNQLNACQMPFQCVICAVIDPVAAPKYLGNKENLKRHYHRHLEYKRFHCQLCHMGFFRKDNTRRHIAKEHKKAEPERYVREQVSLC